jgi:hypothetical protein
MVYPKDIFWDAYHLYPLSLVGYETFPLFPSPLLSLRRVVAVHCEVPIAMETPIF